MRIYFESETDKAKFTGCTCCRPYNYKSRECNMISCASCWNENYNLLLLDEEITTPTTQEYHILKETMIKYFSITLFILFTFCILSIETTYLYLIPMGVIGILLLVCLISGGFDYYDD